VTTPRPRPRLQLTARTWDILRRCYRGQPPADVLEQAAVLKATADGHLDTSGRIKNGRQP
jgi:hypothetical protein